MDQEQFEWLNMLHNAHRLDDKVLARHVSVSTSNRHACRDCFTCACEQVMQGRLLQRARDLMDAETARRVHVGDA